MTIPRRRAAVLVVLAELIAEGRALLQMVE